MEIVLTSENYDMEVKESQIPVLIDFGQHGVVLARQ